MKKKDVFEEANSSTFAVVSLNNDSNSISLEVVSKPKRNFFKFFSSKQNKELNTITTFHIPEEPTVTVPKREISRGAYSRTRNERSSVSSRRNGIASSRASSRADMENLKKKGNGKN